MKTNKNKKKGFTLVELLAVIVILAIVLVIAVPKVMSIIEDAKKGTLETTAKMIASQAEKKKIENAVLENTGNITCESIAKLNDIDYEDCSIEFDGNTAKVTIIGSGKFEGINVCEGIKTSANASDKDCPVLASKYITKLLREEENKHNGLVQTTAVVNEKTVDAGIRYLGANPNNYVYFNCKDEYTNNSKTIKYGDDNYIYKDNCEIWRIIGVFDTKKTDSETEIPVKRVKIIRNEVLNKNMSWDTSEDGIDYVDQWGETTLNDDKKTPYIGASLMQYLNGNTEGNYYHSLSSIAKGQIDDALWYTGRVADGTTSEVYEDERGNAIGISRTVNYTTRWTGKIGLIYLSDFGYAGANCGGSGTSGYVSSCGKTDNWLTLSGKYYWLISSSTKQGLSAWNIGNPANLYADFVNYTNYVRPTLYPSSNVKIISGNGNDEPYILSI